jgi:hypothetical protein
VKGGRGDGGALRKGSGGIMFNVIAGPFPCREVPGLEIEVAVCK